MFVDPFFFERRREPNLRGGADEGAMQYRSFHWLALTRELRSRMQVQERAGSHNYTRWFPGIRNSLKVARLSSGSLNHAGGWRNQYPAGFVTW